MKKTILLQITFFLLLGMGGGKHLLAEELPPEQMQSVIDTMLELKPANQACLLKPDVFTGRVSLRDKCDKMFEVACLTHVKELTKKEESPEKPPCIQYQEFIREYVVPKEYVGVSGGRGIIAVPQLSPGTPEFAPAFNNGLKKYMKEGSGKNIASLFDDLKSKFSTILDKRKEEWMENTEDTSQKKNITTAFEVMKTAVGHTNIDFSNAYDLCIGDQRNVVVTHKGGQTTITPCAGAMLMKPEEVLGLLAKALASSIDPCSMNMMGLVGARGATLANVFEPFRRCLLKNTGATGPKDYEANSPFPHCNKGATEDDLIRGEMDKSKVAQDQSNDVVRQYWADKMMSSWLHDQPGNVENKIKLFRKAFHPFCQKVGKSAMYVDPQKLFKSLISKDEELRHELGCFANDSSICDYALGVGLKQFAEIRVAGEASTSGAAPGTAGVGVAKEEIEKKKEPTSPGSEPVRSAGSGAEGSIQGPAVAVPAKETPTAEPPKKPPAPSSLANNIDFPELEAARSQALKELQRQCFASDPPTSASKGKIAGSQAVEDLLNVCNCAEHGTIEAVDVWKGSKIKNTATAGAYTFEAKCESLCFCNQSPKACYFPQISSVKVVSRPLNLKLDDFINNGKARHYIEGNNKFDNPVSLLYQSCWGRRYSVKSCEKNQESTIDVLEEESHLKISYLCRNDCECKNNNPDYNTCKSFLKDSAKDPVSYIQKEVPTTFNIDGPLAFGFGRSLKEVSDCKAGATAVASAPAASPQGTSGAGVSKQALSTGMAGGGATPTAEKGEAPSPATPPVALPEAKPSLPSSGPSIPSAVSATHESPRWYWKRVIEPRNEGDIALETYDLNPNEFYADHLYSDHLSVSKELQKQANEWCKHVFRSYERVLSKGEGEKILNHPREQFNYFCQEGKSGFEANSRFKEFQALEGQGVVLSSESIAHSHENSPAHYAQNYQCVYNCSEDNGPIGPHSILKNETYTKDDKEVSKETLFQNPIKNLESDWLQFAPTADKECKNRFHETKDHPLEDVDSDKVEKMCQSYPVKSDQQTMLDPYISRSHLSGTLTGQKLLYQCYYQCNCNKKSDKAYTCDGGGAVLIVPKDLEKLKTQKDLVDALEKGNNRWEIEDLGGPARIIPEKSDLNDASKKLIKDQCTDERGEPGGKDDVCSESVVKAKGIAEWDTIVSDEDQKLEFKIRCLYDCKKNEAHFQPAFPPSPSVPELPKLQEAKANDVKLNLNRYLDSILNKEQTENTPLSYKISALPLLGGDKAVQVQYDAQRNKYVILEKSNEKGEPNRSVLDENDTRAKIEEDLDLGWSSRGQYNEIDRSYEANHADEFFAKKKGKTQEILNKAKFSAYLNSTHVQKIEDSIFYHTYDTQGKAEDIQIQYDAVRKHYIVKKDGELLKPIKNKSDALWTAGQVFLKIKNDLNEGWLHWPGNPTGDMSFVRADKEGLFFSPENRPAEQKATSAIDKKVLEILKEIKKLEKAEKEAPPAEIKAPAPPLTSGLDQTDNDLKIAQADFKNKLREAKSSNVVRTQVLIAIGKLSNPSKDQLSSEIPPSEEALKRAVQAVAASEKLCKINEVDCSKNKDAANEQLEVAKKNYSMALDLNITKKSEQANTDELAEKVAEDQLKAARQAGLADSPSSERSNSATAARP